MNFITGKRISRRTMLQSMGGAIGLPLLDAMEPAGRVWKKFSPRRADEPTRLVCIEQVHGAAGSSELGAQRYLWSPRAEGKDFDLSPSSLRPLEPYRKHLTIVSNTECRGADAHTPQEIGGDHFRTTAVWLTQARPKQTEGSDLRAGTSMDQYYVQKLGEQTPIPSLQLTIENVDQAGGCAYGYACAYTDTVSWATPSEPLPMVRDPRAVFQQLFGAGGTPEQRALRLETDRSILDWMLGELNTLKHQLGPADRQRVTQYTDNIRELEQRIHRIERHNTSGEERQIPEAPVGVPDDFREHVELMFDLQLLAFVSDTTRVFSLKLGRDASPRVYAESGVSTPFHAASHHGGREDRVLDFAKINEYHVSMLPYFLEKLENTMEGDASLLDRSLILYGSAMADGNLHNHIRCPLILLGHANGQVAGERHIIAPPGTPMANVMLDLLHRLGVTDIATFGDSTGSFAV
jgi:hypothetical protein